MSSSLTRPTGILILTTRELWLNVKPYSRIPTFLGALGSFCVGARATLIRAPPSARGRLAPAR
eukprot:3399061-Pyramimonas_sp.AAC.1